MYQLKITRFFYFLCLVGLSLCVWALFEPQILVNTFDLSFSPRSRSFGKLVKTENQVYRRFGDFLVWLPIKKDSTLHLNDRIYTSDKALAEIEFDGGMLNLEPRTLVVLRKIGEIPFFDIEYGEGRTSDLHRKVMIRTGGVKRELSPEKGRSGDSKPKPLSYKPPELIYPGRETVLTRLEEPVTFSWKAPSQNFVFRVQVASDANFEDLVKDGETSENAWLVKLNKKQLYFWRVGVVGENDIQWTKAFSFYLGANTSLDAKESTTREVSKQTNSSGEELGQTAEKPTVSPSLSEPLEGKKPSVIVEAVAFSRRSYVVKNHVKNPKFLEANEVILPLKWAPHEGVDEYKIEVLDKKEKNKVLFSKKVKGSFYRIQYPWIKAQEPQVKISVFNKNLEKWISGKLSVSSIKVESKLILPEPKLEQPKNQSKVFAIGSGNSKKVLVSWYAVPHAVGYDLQVATESDFKNLIIEKKIKKSSKMLMLPTNTKKLFWRVKAWHKEHQSEWSDKYEFEVQ